jgi:hypothetical protein
LPPEGQVCAATDAVRLVGSHWLPRSRPAVASTRPIAFHRGAAEARIASTTAAARVTANDLTSRLAEAYGRYEANRQIVLNYRDKILPSLTQSYRGLVQRYQTEPGKVGFSDVVVGQQNLAQALQNYLTSLNSLWQSVVDLAALTQVDELYLNDPRPVRPPEKGK